MFVTLSDGSKAPVWSETTLRVTFMDGTVVDYPETRFLAVSPKFGYRDPIVIDGTTVVIENFEQSITLCGVRSFTYEFD